MKNSYRILTLGAGLLLSAAVTVAQSGGAPAAAGPPPGKMAIVDIRAAIQSTAQGKQAAAELQSQFSAKKAELENMGKSLEDIQARLRAGERTLSDEERERLRLQGERLNRQYTRRGEDLQQEFNDAQADAFERLGRKMAEVISRYARENSYGVIMDASQACQIYCSNQLDVTQDIIRLYDQANPVKASNSTPAPSRPGTTAPPRPAQSSTQPAKPKP
jgi:outer membrane protein